MSEIVLLPTRVEDWVEGDPIMGVLGGLVSSLYDRAKRVEGQRKGACRCRHWFCEVALVKRTVTPVKEDMPRKG